MAALTNIKVDDIVRCDVRGQRFWALVQKSAHTDKVRGRGITIREMANGRDLLTYFVTSRQVVGHWRKSKGSTVDI